MKNGDRVVCVAADRYGKLTVDRDYIVYAVTDCKGCGQVGVQVGIPTNATNPNCAICDVNSFSLNGEVWYDSRYFRKVEEKREYKVVKSNIEIEEPVLS